MMQRALPPVNVCVCVCAGVQEGGRRKWDCVGPSEGHALCKGGDGS